MTADDEPTIAIIIDDIGDRLNDGRRAVELPGPVNVSFLPHTPFAARLAREAHALGKEVMLHLPMDSMRARTLGPGGLTEEMVQEEFVATLRADIAAIPYVSGINNHMGSRMTTNSLRMDWLMAELRVHDGLFFVDSRTSSTSIAGPMAVRYGVPSAQRDIFLDNERHPAAIARQFDRLVASARHHGRAIGIGHPHDATLTVLEQRLPQLASEGLRLVPVSQVIAEQQEQRPKLWQASLSPSPPAAKNSKP